MCHAGEEDPASGTEAGEDLTFLSLCVPVITNFWGGGIRYTDCTAVKSCCVHVYMYLIWWDGEKNWEISENLKLYLYRGWYDT